MSERDYNGREITKPESPDDMINVWCIEPATRSEGDYLVVRDYQSAVEIAQLTVEALMDDDDNKMPLHIKIWTERMRKGDYDALAEAAGE